MILLSRYIDLLIASKIYNCIEYKRWSTEIIYKSKVQKAFNKRFILSV